MFDSARVEEGRAVHGDVGPSIVVAVGVFRGSGEETFAHFTTVGIREADVGGDPVSKKRVLVGSAGAVDELVRDDDIAGCKFLLQRAYPL